MAPGIAGAVADQNWVVLEDATLEVVGAAYYAPELFSDGVWNLLLLAVCKGLQGQGGGRSIVQFVEAALRHAGARILIIETSGVGSFAASRAFYGKLGYHEEARIREFFGPGDDKVIFCKELGSSVSPTAHS